MNITSYDKSKFELLCGLDDEEIIKHCFTTHKYYTEQQLIKCIIMTKQINQKRLLASYLATHYFDKVNHFKLY